MSAGLGISFAPEDLPPPPARRPLPHPRVRQTVSMADLRPPSPQRTSRFVVNQPEVIVELDDVESEEENDPGRLLATRPEPPSPSPPRRTLGRPQSMMELHSLKTQNPARPQKSPLRQTVRLASTSTTTSSLQRNSTLLPVGTNGGKVERHLGRVLSPAKEKPPSSPSKPHAELEQSKSKHRVELDVVLDSSVLVEGGLLKGRMSIKSKSPTETHKSIWLHTPKVRVVGFEELQATEERHIFYHHSALIQTDASLPCFEDDQGMDQDGYLKAKPGSHDFAFSMSLPLNLGAKGPLKCKQGVVKYIVIGSVKVKSQDDSDHSIAHFYRPVTLYPYLDPATLLAPAPNPLVATGDKTLFLGGTGKVELTASIHRPSWVAGQQCYVSISIENHTNKKLKNLSLAIIQRTALHHTNDKTEEEVQVFKKKMTESHYEVGQKGANGDVTAKGMWLGVEKSSRAEFMPTIVIPSEALTIEKSVYLDVSYFIRVSVSSSLAADVSVELPVTIVNFVSLDPPPGHPSNTNIKEAQPCTEPTQEAETLPIARLNEVVGVRSLPQIPEEGLTEKRLKHHMSLQCISSAIASAARRNTNASDSGSLLLTPDKSLGRHTPIEETNDLLASFPMPAPSAHHSSPTKMSHERRKSVSAYAFATPNSPVRASVPLKSAMKATTRPSSALSRHRRVRSDGHYLTPISPTSPVDMPGLSSVSSDSESTSSRPSVQTPSDGLFSPEMASPPPVQSQPLVIRSKPSVGRLRVHQEGLAWTNQRMSPTGFEINSPRGLARLASVTSYKAPIFRN